MQDALHYGTVEVYSEYSNACMVKYQRTNIISTVCEFITLTSFFLTTVILGIKVKWMQSTT